MLKNKLCKILAAIMVTTTVLGNNVQVVSATELVNTLETEATTEKKFEIGSYTVDNTTEYVESENETGQNMARNALKDKTIINIEENKVTMTLQFSESLYPMMKDIKVSLDGVYLNGINNAENQSITFEVPSVDVKVKVEMTVIAMGKEVAFFVSNDVSTIPTVDDSIVEDENQGITLEDGTYKIANNTFKKGTNNVSGIRGYIDTNSIVTVNGDKITLTVKYNEQGLETVESTNSVIIDGENVDFNKNEDGSISFGIDSIERLYERITINLTYQDENLPEFIFPDKRHTVDVELSHEGDLTKFENDSEEKPGDNGDSNKPEEDNSGNTGNEGSNNGSNNNGSTGGATEEAADKVYTGKNEVTHENATGLGMARQALEETIRVEEINGKNYVTLTFTNMGSTMMKNHEIYVNGNKVEATKTLNGNIISLKFAVNSLDDSIKVSAYVDAMGKTIDFGVNVLKDTLTLVKDEDSDNSTNNGNAGDSTNNGTTNNGTVNDGNTKEEETQTIVGKLYSIQNNVTHENETGKAMARKYLNTTSKVEEIEGKYYITLTFTGSDLMQSHEIYVNGKKATITKSTSGDLTNIRFAISSLSDTIKVKAYIVPMGKDVEFGVELLKDTLTFIKEYTVDKLPQTGAATSSATVAGLGLILSSAGVALAKKRK